MLQFVVYVGVIIVCAVVAVLYLYPVSIMHAVIRCGEEYKNLKKNVTVNEGS